MATETILNELKINYLTEEQYAKAFEEGTLNENEIYMTPDESDFESSDLTYTEYVESVEGEPPVIDPVVQNAINNAVGSYRYTLTEADKKEISVIVTDYIRTGGVVGFVDDENNILLSGNLADGTYTLKYEYADGDIEEVGSMVISSIATYSITKTLSNCTASGATTITESGTVIITVTANSAYKLPDSITVSGASYTWDKASGRIVLSNPTGNVAITVTAEPAYTNVLPLAVDANGNDFVGTNGEDGYINGFRISRTSGGQSASDGEMASGFIPVAYADRIRIKNVVLNTANPTWDNFVFYNSSKTYLFGKCFNRGSVDASQAISEGHFVDGVWDISAKDYVGEKDIAFVRFSFAEISNETIVTINEEIV